MGTDKYNPGEAMRDLSVAEESYPKLAKQVWTASGSAISKADSGIVDSGIAELLKAMRETQKSMRHIYVGVKEQEKNNPASGQWVDMLLLTRPQFDALFIGLLFAHDGSTWIPAYQKAGWAADAEFAVSGLRRFRRTPRGRDARKKIVGQLKRHAEAVGVSLSEAKATIATYRGKPKAGAIKPLPTPGSIINEGLLNGGSYERLGPLCWQQRKFLCDPAHVGIPSLTLRASLRGDPAMQGVKMPRQDIIHDKIVARSILPSLVAILTLVAVVAFRHRDDIDLSANTVNASKVLEEGTHGGDIIWDGWVRGALGILGQ